ncbi:protein phosphatase 2C domain-containing protein [uncultured Chryseobacterium sp.]|uniref:protein phosphatase 2C domain-containing protein n=1 Tax=uncultured Chryseobacterium sp. TaxID=259322 RepID=UPI0025EF7E8D|nr:protein phosphatase 2C domain-containing protein [uncultured Chryseobacterium sp.]
MNIYSALQIGDYHLNHCEDFLITKSIGSHKILCAVMDGCSTAMESQFASALTGKILRKICTGKSYEEMYRKNGQNPLEEELKDILKHLFNEMAAVKNALLLDEKELLTTLILLLYDQKENQGMVLCIGDGLVCIKGKITEFENGNKPDYFAYHLKEDFENWYQKQTQIIIFNDLQDISIATDGISTFSKMRKADAEENIHPVEYICIDKEYYNSEEMLFRKLKKLEHHYGMKPTDDLAVIRIIK